MKMENYNINSTEVSNLTDYQKEQIRRFNLETPEEIELYLTQGLIHYTKIMAAYENHALDI